MQFINEFDLISDKQNNNYERQFTIYKKPLNFTCVDCLLSRFNFLSFKVIFQNLNF